MTLEELWKMTKAELDKLNTKIDKLESKVNQMEQKVDQMEQKVDQIDEIKEKVGQIDGIKQKVDQIDGIKQKVDELQEKMDIMTNVNLAKILEHQVETRKELNDKLDRFILQNNLEHKQFAYQIAQLEMKNGITRIG